MSAKRCSVCGKVLNIGNKSLLCNYHLILDWAKKNKKKNGNKIQEGL